VDNRDVQVTELQMPAQPSKADSRNENDQATTVIASRTVANTHLDAIEDNRHEVVPASQSHEASLAAVNSASAPMTSLNLPWVLSQWESRAVAQLRLEFQRTCLPLFFAEQGPVRTLGLTSAVAGEGKTSVAWLMSYALASSSRRPVVLVECDWEHPTFSRELGLPASPGLAEYLSGVSELAKIRYPLLPNLTVIPAGLGGAEALTALVRLQQDELHDRLADPDDLVILDLPSVLDSTYGVIAARLAESLMIVVRAGGTPSPLVDRACKELRHLRVEGIILNKVQTRIPRWLQRLL
jgi:Mrp family chromosome partitioning ATPase